MSLTADAGDIKMVLCKNCIKEAVSNLHGGEWGKCALCGGDTKALPGTKVFICDSCAEENGLCQKCGESVWEQMKLK